MQNTARKPWRNYLLTATAVLSLTGCDYFDRNWEVQNNLCQSLSDNGEYNVMLSPDSIAFLHMESGCPENLDIFGTRYTTIQINGEPYRAMLLCNITTKEHTVITTGLPTEKGENSIPASSARASEAFTSFFGAKVTIEGQKIHFPKGNIGKVCAKQVPHLARQKGNPPSITLDEMTKLAEKESPSRAVPGSPAARQDKVSPPDTPATQQAVTLTSDIYAKAKEAAKSAWKVYHPGEDPQPLQWTYYQKPDQDVNGVPNRILRYTTTSPATGITSDLDVEIGPDGEPGYVLNTDRPLPAQAAPAEPEKSPPPETTINASCRLDNGKMVSVFAANGQDYRYTYQDQNNTTELELREGLFGVKAWHYETQLGMGKARYIRFNKKQYDYVLLDLDTGRREFHGVRVYKNGDLISSHECFSKLRLDVSGLTDTAHADNERMGEFIAYN